MGRIETELLRKHEREDQYEREYDADDISEATHEEILEAIPHLSTKEFMEFVGAVHEGDFEEVGIQFLEAVKNYRRMD